VELGEKKLNLDVRNIFARSHTESMAGDALKDHRTIPKTLETLMN
jgi:hypothetical protein